MLGIGARLRQVELVGEVACVRYAPGTYRAYFCGPNAPFKRQLAT